MLPGKLICTTCDVSFTTIEGQREHAKSEFHIRRLRIRVAAADLAIPSIQESYRGELCELSDSANEDPPQADSEEEQLPEDNEMAEFLPENCLFCPLTSASLGQNLAHMKTRHGFNIPYQSHVAVETETLLWYLHLVIFGFHECISCGKQRRTLEGVQHHMLKKSHCRFDMTDDMMEFYNTEEMHGHSIHDCVRTDEESLRLPCGKLLSNRSQVPYLKRPLPHKRQNIPMYDGSSHLLLTQGCKGPSLLNQLLFLPVNERRNLAHLPASMQLEYLRRRKKDTASNQIAAANLEDKMERRMMRRFCRYSKK